jgi:hypothetical protein
MIAVDPVDRGGKALSGIEPIQLAVARDEMSVGEDNEFHRTMVSRSHAV